MDRDLSRQIVSLNAGDRPSARGVHSGADDVVEERRPEGVEQVEPADRIAEVACQHELAIRVAQTLAEAKLVNPAAAGDVRHLLRQRRHDSRARPAVRMRVSERAQIDVPEALPALRGEGKPGIERVGTRVDLDPKHRKATRLEPW